MTNTFKTLAVSHNFNLEGASLSMFELLDGLSTRKIIEPVVMSFVPGPIGDQYINAGIGYRQLPFDANQLRYSDQILQAISSLADEIREQQYSLVYSNTFLGYPAVLAAAQCNVPVVWNIRESQDMEFWQNYLGDRLELALEAFSHATAVVFVAQATQDLWRPRVNETKWYVICNAFDAKAFATRKKGLSRSEWRRDNEIDENAVVLLNVGTFHERKGQLDLIEALARMGDQTKEVVVVCVGDNGGSYSDKVHSYVASLPDEQRQRLRILPRTNAVGDAYAAADIFVCCSRNESYPRIILEAMAAALPIVTTPVFGINEQVRFGENAFSYEAGDIDDLINHLIQLTSDINLREQMGMRGRSRLDELPGVENMLDAYSSVIMQAMQSDRTT